MMFFLLLILSLVARYKTKYTIGGVIQDVFIAAEIALLPRPLAIGAGLIASLYILADVWLLTHLKTRMHPSYFSFIKEWRSFYDSAIALGVRMFIFFALVILGILLILPPFPFSWATLFTVVALGMLSYWKSSPATNNAFFSLQLSFLPRRRKVRDIPPLPSFLIPPSEKAEYVSPQFPLLKNTMGFEGVKQLDISLEKKPPHLVFLFLESFRGKDVGARVTPYFEQAKQEGAYFSQFYSNGILTHQAVIASLFGIYPFFGSIRAHSIYDEPHSKVDFSKLPLISLADLLKKEGYHTAYIDAALSLESEKKFFRQHGFDTVTGRHDFSASQTTSWGAYDKDLMTHAVSWLEQEMQKGSPLFTVLFTVSNHHPWQTPEGYDLDPFEDIEDETHASFMRTMHYSDWCLGQFLQNMKDKGLTENMVLFIMGDHGQGMGEHGLERLQNSVYEENIHVPLLILAPGRLASTTVATPASQIDLLPTVMDLLKLKGLNHSMGRSLLREGSMPIFYNNAHIGFSLGCRMGAYKYVHSDLLTVKKELFNLTQDPEERVNLLEEDQEPYAAMVDACYRFMEALYEKGNFTLNMQQTLDCSEIPQLTEEKLQALLEVNGKPRTLNLSNCLQLSDKSLKLIVSHASNLRHLHLNDCLVSFEALKAFLSKVPQLETLDLSGCPLLSEKEVAHLKDTYPHLTIS